MTTYNSRPKLLARNRPSHNISLLNDESLLTHSKPRDFQSFSTSCLACEYSRFTLGTFWVSQEKCLRGILGNAVVLAAISRVPVRASSPFSSKWVREQDSLRKCEVTFYSWNDQLAALCWIFSTEANRQERSLQKRWQCSWQRNKHKGPFY